MNNLLEKCLQSATLRDLSLEHNDLSMISAELLAKVCARLHYINLQSTNLTTAQITTIFKVFSKISLTLKRICLGYGDASDVPAEAMHLTQTQKLQILVEAVSSTTIQSLTFGYECDSISLKSSSRNPKLYKLKLSERDPPISMPPKFVRTLLDKVLKSKNLYTLDLSGVNLAFISSNLIAKVVSDLHGNILNLRHTRLSSEAITSILRAILQSKRIKNLNLNDNTLTNVSADLLGDVTYMLSEISLEACCLTTEQSTKVLQTSTVCYMRFNDLSSVDPVIIYNKIICKQYAYGIAKPETPADSLLCNTSLSTEQIKIIFQKYCEREEVLVNFKISQQNLSKIPVSLLSKFVLTFSNVSMTYCNLRE